MHTPKNGELRTFVAKHSNLQAAILADEARRLLALAKDENISTTENSIAVLLSKLRKDAETTAAADKPTKRPQTKVAHKKKARNGVDPVTAWTLDARQQLKTIRASLDVLAKTIDAMDTERLERRKRLDSIRQSFVDGVV